MPSHVMKPAMPDVFSSHRYTVLSPYSDVRKHSAPTAVGAYSALRGTPPGDSFANTFGARPSTARLKSIRVDAYMPELPADSTAVRITAFITPAANARPAW